MSRTKKNGTGVEIQNRTEKVILIKKENLDILIKAFTTWLNADETGEVPAAVAFQDENGKITFAYGGSDEDDDGRDEA